jgi:hypothetical protein
VTIVGVLTLCVAATLFLAVAFDRRIQREIDGLLADAITSRGDIVTEDGIGQLPVVVQRWLRYSRVVGARRPGVVRLRQRGEFDLGRGWMPFRAEQYFTINPPAFVWRARFQMAPLMTVFGRDRYQAGVGSIDMRLLSLLPVAKKTGGGLNQGDLLRFLGEMQWFPSAALSDYVKWESVDVASARATMEYGGIAASMTFRFDADGRLLEERAFRYNDARGRDEAWVNRNDSDADFQEFRVPATGEARWEYDTGSVPYIRWRISALEFD